MPSPTGDEAGLGCSDRYTPGRLTNTWLLPSASVIAVALNSVKQEIACLLEGVIPEPIKLQ